ncbi:hypothetical protein [Dietzia maris]|uniref:hypothetical protein n=1 Tax=Dietzia maris TaxID=37915 RepID=UPI001045B8DB
MLHGEVRVVRIMAPWEVEFEAAHGDATVHTWRRERRLRTAGVASGTAYGHGWLRGDADERVLEFVSRFSVASVRQLALWFYDGSVHTARQRVQKMVEAGLLDRESTLSWAGTVVWPTLDGQRVALGEGHPLIGSFRPPESQMLHRLLVSERGAEFFLAGVEVFSEREIRLFEQRGPGEFGQWLSERGVKAGDGTSAGVVPSVYSEELNSGEMMRRERWLACPTGTARKSLRFPDLVAVTPEGELRAVEVELAPKETPRLAAIVDGYRDAGPYLSTVTEVVDGKSRTVAKMRRRQFRYVDWYATPPVRRALLGDVGAVHPTTGSPSLGVIRDSYMRGRSDVTGRTDHVYTEVVNVDGGQERRLMDWPGSGVITNRPMSARALPMPADDGLAWRVQQLCLTSTYQFPFREWGRWRDVWLRDLEQLGRQPDDSPFHEWLRAGDNLRRCKERTR